MAALPQRAQPTVDAIYADYEARADNGFRPHLGASLIGAPCDRALWLTFRWVTKSALSGRMLRLYQTGQREEERLIANLRASGIEIHEFERPGEQFRVSECGGHFAGSLDGVGLGFLEAPTTWHVVEFKTHGEKSFKELVAKGVESAKPLHAAQMQTYMHLTGMTRAFYLSVNKNTDQLYSERLHYDAEVGIKLVAKARRIIFSARPPSRISVDPSWFMCRFCDHADVCHGDKRPSENCRTCIRSTPEHDGSWTCPGNGTLPLDFQRSGCGNPHLWHPDLINDTQVDAGDDWIEYRRKDGTTWRDGR